MRESFEEFEASELFCSKCKRPTPTRKRLLLVLPGGDKFEYYCAVCNSIVGSKTEKNVDQPKLLTFNRRR